MIQVGTFGEDKPRARGRPRWKLVDESIGHEVDITADFCIPVISRSMKKTLDADKEEWDIFDNGASQTTSVRNQATHPDFVCNSRTTTESTIVRRTPPTKPSVERKRKISNVFDSQEESNRKSRLNNTSGDRNRQQKHLLTRENTPEADDKLKSNFNGTRVLRSQVLDDFSYDNARSVRNMSKSEHSEGDETRKKTSASVLDESTNKRRTSRRNGEESPTVKSMRPRLRLATCTFLQSKSTASSHLMEQLDSDDESNETTSSDFSLSDDESDKDCVEVRKSRSRSRVSKRPYRQSAPKFLGESPMPEVDEKPPSRRSIRVPSSAFLTKSISENKPHVELRSRLSPLDDGRNLRKSASSFMEGEVARKPRNVKNVGSSRVVLQG